MILQVHLITINPLHAKEYVTIAFSELCYLLSFLQLQAVKEATLEVTSGPQLAELNYILLFFTLWSRKVRLKYGQITPNTVTHP